MWSRTVRIVAAAALVSVVLGGCGAPESSGSHPQETTNEDIAEGVEAVVETPGTIKDGLLTVCMAFANPPNSYYTSDRRETGIEVDIGRLLGALMGLETTFRETKFASIIPTLRARQCDVIMASLYIKPEREEVVDFVPYLRSGQLVVVSSENPKHVTGYDDSLCGTKVGFQVSTTAEDYVKEQIAQCEEAGLEEIATVTTEESTLGLQQVQAGQVDAFVDTQSHSIYTVGQSEGRLEIVGEPFGLITIGAAVNKGDAELKDALTAAFDEVVASGRYAEILADYDSANMALDETG